MPPTADHRSPTGQRVTPAVFGVSATGTAHRGASEDAVRDNAVRVLLARHVTSERMAARMEQHAADCARMREQSIQARSEFQPGIMREQRAEQE